MTPTDNEYIKEVIEQLKGRIEDYRNIVGIDGGDIDSIETLIDFSQSHLDRQELKPLEVATADDNHIKRIRND